MIYTSDTLKALAAAMVHYTHDQWEGTAISPAKIDAHADAWKAVEQRLEAAAAALAWYEEKATAMARYMDAKPPMAEAMTAVCAELALDNGRRAALAAGGQVGLNRMGVVWTSDGTTETRAAGGEKDNE